jgi:hypothetical protein
MGAILAVDFKMRVERHSLVFISQVAVLAIFGTRSAVELI